MDVDGTRMQNQSRSIIGPRVVGEQQERSSTNHKIAWLWSDGTANVGKEEKEGVGGIERERREEKEEVLGRTKTTTLLSLSLTTYHCLVEMGTVSHSPHDWVDRGNAHSEQLLFRQPAASACCSLSHIGIPFLMSGVSISHR